MLKIRKRNVIDVNDLDKLVTSTYGKIYSYQQQDGCKARGIKTVTVPANEDDFEATNIPLVVNGPVEGVRFQTWLDTSPQDTRKYFNEDYENILYWKRNFYPHISMILNDLHKKGLIEEGEYDINIDW